MWRAGLAWRMRAEGREEGLFTVTRSRCEREGVQGRRVSALRAEMDRHLYMCGEGGKGGSLVTLEGTD